MVGLLRDVFALQLPGGRCLCLSLASRSMRRIGGIRGDPRCSGPHQLLAGLVESGVWRRDDGHIGLLCSVRRDFGGNGFTAVPNRGSVLLDNQLVLPVRQLLRDADGVRELLLAEYRLGLPGAGKLLLVAVLLPVSNLSLAKTEKGPQGRKRDRSEGLSPGPGLGSGWAGSGR